MSKESLGNMIRKIRKAKGISHTGIGRYEDTEKMIQKLLADKSN